MWLAYQSTGIIYGDIGTSPLYVYSSTFTHQPSYDDLLGALSIILWTLTIMVTIKYIFIVLSADDDGEGGTFALYSLLARYVNIVQRDPNVAGTVRLDRYVTNDLNQAAKGLRAFLENSSLARVALKVIGVLGVSMVMVRNIQICTPRINVDETNRPTVSLRRHSLFWVLSKASGLQRQILQQQPSLASPAQSLCFYSSFSPSV